MMEDHDKAYQAWKDRGVFAKTLVHVDAHIDFGWIPEVDLDEIGGDGKVPGDGQLINPFVKSKKKMVDIGNYICPAIREGMVKKFYWVVPDASFRNARGRRHIIRHLKRLLAIKKYSGGKLEFHSGRICCRIYGIELIVCGLEDLGQIDEPVLLDIDVDFMLTELIWDDLNPERLPWILPEELYEKLTAKIDKIDVLTIAYSVEGGFTPLRFKYLGDELRYLFEGGRPAGPQGAAYYKRKAVFFEKDKKPADAARAYEEALKTGGSDASVFFNLSLLYSYEAVGQAEKSAVFYRKALEADESYATCYNNYGILYLRYNRLKRAEAEYKKFLRVSGGNAAVYDGLGVIALARGRYAQAQEFFNRCLTVDKNHPGARLGLGIVCFKTARLSEAESLFLGLEKDYPDDAEVCWWLGRIAQKSGNASCAIDRYKDAVMRGGDGPFIHFILARLYMKRGFFFRAFEELIRVFQAFRTGF